MRYADDGKLYPYEEFVEYYCGQAQFMWECALPQDVGQAREKVTYVIRAYRAVVWRLGLDVDVPTWNDWRDSDRAQAPGEAEMATGDSAAAAEPEPPNEEKNCPRWRHFDYVEVGTSDWGTLTQFCAGQQRTNYVSWLGADIRTSISDPWWVRGLAVEPVKEWLDALPNLPRVTKVEAAMGERSGEATLYGVSPENVALHKGKLEFNGADVMWYAKSLSSITKPSPDLLEMLRGVQREDLLEQREVQVLSWGDLCNQYGIGTVDVVQLDCEGMDCSILRGLLEHCEAHPNSLPRIILFEANHLTDDSEVEETLTALEEHGYSIQMRTISNIIVEQRPAR